MNRRNTNLARYFPMIRARDDILKEIVESPALKKKYDEWKAEARQDFLKMCTGERGIKILYDAYFKEVMNPEFSPDRMSALLSVLLGKEVKVIGALPVESRIADEDSLLILDILVQTIEGNLINCEVQKVGYNFMGARASCYSADLLLRQYKRVREQREKGRFSYQNIKDVYTIVFFERSPQVFHEFYASGKGRVSEDEKECVSDGGNMPKCDHKNRKKEVLIHRMSQKSDTGIEIDLLQKYCFIPLDIFNQVYQNRPIDTELAAWLTFLSTDRPERIAELIESYPEFKPLYEDLYNMCRNVESVMDMYSKELAELDRNTVHLMIDELQEENEEYRREIEEYRRENERKEREHKAQLAEKEKELKKLSEKILELESK